MLAVGVPLRTGKEEYNLAPGAIDLLSEAVIHTATTGHEAGFGLCRTDNPTTLAGSRLCKGDKCSVSIDRACSATLANQSFGSFHMHPSGGIGMSVADMTNALYMALLTGTAGPECIGEVEDGRGNIQWRHLRVVRMVASSVAGFAFGREPACQISG